MGRGSCPGWGVGVRPTRRARRRLSRPRRTMELMGMEGTGMDIRMRGDGGRVMGEGRRVIMRVRWGVGTLVRPAGRRWRRWM